MKVTIELEVDDDFEPCTYGCDRDCPFGYLDDDGHCYHIYYDDYYEWTCPVNEAIEKGGKDE